MIIVSVRLSMKTIFCRLFRCWPFSCYIRESYLNSKPKRKPTYYVIVRAESLSGLKGSRETSLPMLVFGDDSASEVFAGPTPDPVTQQVYHDRVVGRLHDLRSRPHGMDRSEFAVGSAPGPDDVPSRTDA